MTNPSISDMVKTDYTTMFIINNLVKLDYGSFDILNLIPKISIKINLAEIEDIPDEIFDENVKYIKKSAEQAETVVIAWGSLESKAVTSIKNEVLDSLKPFEDKLFTISNEYGGKSYHPLAPQIRSIWLFNKYDVSDKKQDEEKDDKSDDTSEVTEINTDVLRGIFYMVYKIGTLKQFEEVKENIPSAVYNAIYSIVATLDREYGEHRNVDESDGGFVVYADSQDEIKDVIKVMHLNKKVPELMDDIGDYLNVLYLKNNEYGINFFCPMNPE
jgi:hypothetical protein